MRKTKKKKKVHLPLKTAKFYFGSKTLSLDSKISFASAKSKAEFLMYPFWFSVVIVELLKTFYTESLNFLFAKVWFRFEAKLSLLASAAFGSSLCNS